jgi:polar amino acid transport system permease protein
MAAETVGVWRTVPVWRNEPVRWLVGAALVVLAVRAGLLGSTAHWARVWARLPELLVGAPGFSTFRGGFLDNILISIAAMVMATVGGTFLGFALLARPAMLRVPAVVVMNFLRNSPWLVLLFATLYLLPFQVKIGPWSIEFPPAAKAVVGLALPIGANFAEVIRGAVQSIHSGQWESARSLGYTTAQSYRRIILPQSLRRIMPGWMNLYALLTIGTALATVTGTQEVLTVLQTILATEDPAVIVYFYLVVFALFFFYCYPIARLARRLERSVRGDAL